MMPAYVDTVRAYYSGAHVLAEVDVVLPRTMTLEEAHDIGESLQQALERVTLSSARSSISTSSSRIRPKTSTRVQHRKTQNGRLITILASHHARLTGVRRSFASLRGLCVMVAAKLALFTTTPIFEEIHSAWKQLEHEGIVT
jgi:hypothetical protein